MTRHLIIGGGPAATNAALTIRQLDPQADIVLASDEPAHSRMALPYWLAGQIPRAQTHTGDDKYFHNLSIQTRFGVRVTRLDMAQGQAQLSNGDSESFDKVLVATGARPLQAPFAGADLPGVMPMWTLENIEQAMQSVGSDQQPRVVLIGAGFIGFIILNAMFKRGWRLTVVEREDQVLPRMLDADAANMVQQWLDQRGVSVHAGVEVKQIHAGDPKQVELADGRKLDADLVVVAIGIQPNLELVRDAGAEVDQAVLVNDRMQTSVENLYAAGDMAQGPALYSDERQVHAIQPTAVDQGRMAGANMAGRDVTYPGSLIMNVVDVCGLQAASFGAWDDPQAEATVISSPGGRVYRKLMWRDDRLVGAIFLGQPNDMGMLTDVGMVKGILQTQTPLGPWRAFLEENPFDIRRAYVAAGVAQKLAGATLLGQPSKSREYRYGGAQPKATATDPAAHAAYTETKAAEDVKIRVKLMGVFKDRTPPDESLELPEGATVADALGKLELPVERIAVCTVNGGLERDLTRPLADDDLLSVLPPVGGG